MKNKRLILIIAMVVLVIGVGACTRSLRPSSDATATVGVVSEEMPSSGTEVMGQIYLFATQTARSEQGITLETDTDEPSEGVPGAEATQPAEGQEPVPEATQEVIPTNVEVPPPTTGKPQEYTLQKGEFPYCIARRFDVNPNELLRVNNIQPGSTLQEGITLSMPKSDRTYPGERTLRQHPTTYNVQNGDTIYSIACLYGDVDPNAIASVNNLATPYELSTGQELQIP